MVRRWHEATSLPADQLDPYTGPRPVRGAGGFGDRTQAGLQARQMADRHPDWRLPELAEELGTVARNERRFIGFAEADISRSEQYKGQVVVTTMHKAKGLEWDKSTWSQSTTMTFPSACLKIVSSRSRGTSVTSSIYRQRLAQLEALDANPDLFDYDEGTRPL